MNHKVNQSPSSVSYISVEEDIEGQRIDNFLLSRLKGVPKSHIYRILRRGEVRVNKGRVKAVYRLKTGDEIRIPPMRLSETPIIQPARDSLQAIAKSILYEDKRIIVINKPAGMAVHGGSGISYGVIEAMRKLREEEHSLELVHRLDRETSGCLLIAKKRSALRQLHELFRDNQIEKRYHLLVKGHWQGKQQHVKLPLRKSVLRSGERIVRVSDEGKFAHTLFRPLYVSRDYSLLEAILYTGRTHQIRVHAAHIGFPIAADDKYGDRSFNHKLQSMGLQRLALHARSLAFTLHEPHKELAINAPYDDELTAFFDKIRIGV